MVALLLVALVAAGARVPGAELARAVASRMLCAAALADRCGDEPTLIAAYGTEVGQLVHHHMPTILFERGSRAMPVDFRRCRSSVCSDGTARGLVHESDAGLPVTAFVHVIDCREARESPGIEASGSEGPTLEPDCSGPRAGNLYLQYWTYYPDSATLRGVPVAGSKGYHRDDWESVQLRIRPDGRIDERASSHHGYNHAQSVANAGSDAGVASLRTFAEDIGGRPRNGWGPETRLLVVSGGSHAGNTTASTESPQGAASTSCPWSRSQPRALPTVSPSALPGASASGAIRRRSEQSESDTSRALHWCRTSSSPGPDAPSATSAPLPSIRISAGSIASSHLCAPTPLVCPHRHRGEGKLQFQGSDCGPALGGAQAHV
jgi:hypothetical protein